MPNTYPVRALRSFDRNIFRGSARSAPRVLEQVPYCWMCPTTSGPRAREHLFPQWLLREFDAEHDRFEPTRYVSLWNGGVVGSQRGPLTANALTVGAVCAPCNNGWMASLESAARPYLLGEDKHLTAEAILTLARWFAKTAIIINVSQPYRLLWHNTRRHQAQTRVPDNVAISLYRVAEPDLNWRQGSQMSWHSVPSALDQMHTSTLHSGLTHVCLIQVGTLVGVVVAYPWQLAASTLTMPGQLLWSHGAGHELDLDALPVLGGLQAEDPSFDVETSAFWSGHAPVLG